MKTTLLRKVLAAGVLAGCALSSNADAAVNLITNGSFENGTWDGTIAFVDPANSTDLLYWNDRVSQWTPNSGSSWVQDPLRAKDGNRMVWLGQPAFSSETYISQTVATASLTSGSTYRLSVDIDFFDRTDPTGAMAMTSTFNVYYMLGTYMFMGDPNNPMLMDSFGTYTALLSTSGIIDSWANGASMNWQTHTIDFTAPFLDGYDYLRIFFSVPNDTVGTPSNGVLVDNISLVTVPEPGSLLLAAAGLAAVRRRRR